MKKHTVPTVGHSKEGQATKVKRLKVQSKFFRRAYHAHAVFPEIIIAGKWLEDLGFTCGEEVMVIQEECKITISLMRAGVC